nr:molecular chaperone DnaJ [Dermatophilus congolensis]
MVNDYYADLGVERGAPDEEIKKAYRRKARKLHPDVNPGPDAEEQFKKISQAYDVLGDPSKRKAYDAGADPYASGGEGYAGNFSFSDIMDAFFGGATGASRGPRSRVQRGQDALVRLDIDLATAVFGGEQEIVVDTAEKCGTCHGEGTANGTKPVICDACGGAGEVQQVQRSFLGQVMTSRPCTKCQGYGTLITNPCFECSGEGRVRTRRTLNLKVPAGVDTGTRIQLSGQGEVGIGGGPAADLYIEIAVRAHPTFRRRNDDLHCQLHVPMTAAALGTTISLETLDGNLDVRIEPGTQSGDVQTLRGYGVTHLRGQGRGDLLIQTIVDTPTRLDAEQTDLLWRLAALRGEEQPQGKVGAIQENHGLFGKLRDAFRGK